MVKIRFYDPDDPPAPREVRASGLQLDWPQNLGWKDNAFHPLVSPSHAYIINQDSARQKLNLFFIKEQRVALIKGGPASGKTFLLQWVAEELQVYKDRYTSVSVDVTQPLSEFIPALTAPYNSFFTKFRGLTPTEVSAFIKKQAKKTLVLLIDNADQLGPQEPYIKSLIEHQVAVAVLTGAQPSSMGFEALDVPLEQLSETDAIQLVAKRISHVGGQGIRPFNEQLLKELWKTAKANPLHYLQLCSDAALNLSLHKTELPQDSTKPDAHAIKQYDDFISELLK